MNDLIDINSVKDRLLMVRGEPSLLDRDVASLYGVQTKAVNQAVRNNPEKFPKGFVVELTTEETEILRSGTEISSNSASEGNGLRSKKLTANISSKSRVAPKVFTERGLYMLARTYQRTVKAESIGGWNVAVTFADGSSGVFDFTPFADYPCYAALKKPGVFSCVRADHGTLSWPGDIDIAPEAVWTAARQNP